jgi:hypothetical protein
MLAYMLPRWSLSGAAELHPTSPTPSPGLSAAALREVAATATASTASREKRNARSCGWGSVTASSASGSWLGPGGPGEGCVPEPRRAGCGDEGPVSGGLSTTLFLRPFGFKLRTNVNGAPSLTLLLLLVLLLEGRPRDACGGGLALAGEEVCAKGAGNAADVRRDWESSRMPGLALGGGGRWDPFNVPRCAAATLFVTSRKAKLLDCSGACGDVSSSLDRITRRFGRPAWPRVVRLLSSPGLPAGNAAHTRGRLGVSHGAGLPCIIVLAFRDCLLLKRWGSGRKAA